jgi:hypothetical protein
MPELTAILAAVRMEQFPDRFADGQQDDSTQLSKSDQ